MDGKPQPHDFQTTHWSLVLEAAHNSSPNSRKALAELCEAYWYPLYAYVRRRMNDVHEAQDLTQAFLTHLLEKKAIGKADPDRGRFRSFLLAALNSEAPPQPIEETIASPTPSGFAPATPADLAAHFPQLEIIELLGRGGMGAVYKARQRDLHRLVALKILPREISGDPAFAERFGREARALAKLNHPHIVTVYDSGRAGNLYYFVMEFIDGVNLRQAIQASQLSPHEALAIVPQICDALQYAHDEGIVHRDIKPENILLDKKGRVKVADFGLSKLLASGERPSDFSLTGTHQVPIAEMKLSENWL